MKALLPLALLLGLSAGVAAPLPLRLFDFTPPSAENPVLARIDDSLEIPASELRAFVAAERSSRQLEQLSPTERHQALRDLADEYLLVIEAKRRGAEQTGPFRLRMDYTRRMLLSEFLVGDEVGARATTADDYARRLASLRREIFDSCPIAVSNESHALFAQLAAETAAALARSAAPEAEKRLFAEATARAGHATLARYGSNAVPVRKALVFYLYLPPGDRPEVGTPAGLTKLLEELLLPDLLADEAQRRGLEQRDDFRAKVAENESALLRMFMQDQLRRELLALPAPSEAELARWYLLRRDRYARAAASPLVGLDGFDGQRERVQSDFLEERAAELRAKRLRKLRVQHRMTFEPPTLAAMP